MKKKIIILYVLYVVFAVLYFMLFSQELYHGGVIIPLYYPAGILSCILLTAIYNRAILKKSFKFWTLNCLAGIAIFVLIRFLLGWILRGYLDYYYISGYENLFHIFSYMAEEPPHYEY